MLQTHTKNQKAPSFTGIDMFGQSFSSEQFAGKKVYLTFFRTASCPFCNLRMHQLINRYEKWKNPNLIVVAVFSSTREDILNYAGKQNPPFTIIADPDEILYKKFGVGHSYWGMFKAMFRFYTLFQIIKNGFLKFKAMTEKPILTGDFLMDEKGNFLETYYGQDFGDHLEFEKIEEILSI